jgi:ABC-type polysaccharide/polyol phosphate transport system ATPase subunit
MAHIKLSKVFVSYPVYGSSRQRSIFGSAANRVAFGRIAREAGRVAMVDALRGLSFELGDGDRLALFGRNGSGKSTLLKLCSGLLVADSGRVDLSGSRASLLHVGAGMDLEMTGAENVDMVGSLLGVSRSGRALLAEDVAEFTELGEFLNLPIRTYSTGMLVRLMFALATAVHRDILIVDEIIGAGDAMFVHKASQRLLSLFERSKILVLATHSGELAAQMCNCAVWIDGGKAVMFGEPRDVWEAFAHNQRPVGQPERLFG